MILATYKKMRSNSAQFKFTQKQLIDRLTRGSHGRSEAFPNMDVAVAQFAKEYFNLRRQCALSPGFTGNASNVQSTTQPPTTSASSPVVQPSPHLPATAILSRQQNQIVPPGRVSQPTASRMVSGSHVEAARNISKRTASQPVAANNAQSEIGLRQQTFMQETLGVQVPGQTTVQNQGWRPSGFQQSPVLVGPRNAQSSSSGIVAPGPIITNRPTTSLNGASVTIQNSHLTLERTPLLPPPGRLMTQNTHPNPDLLALHQARLSTPEPSIPKVEENSPVLPRLFLVFERFALTPQLITKQQSYYSWQINIPEVDKFRTALDVPVRTQPGRPVPLKREYRRGSFIYRLRCIKLTARLQDTDEAAWAVAPTFWPVSCFVSLNAEEIEIRRKSHWGRNLPCDLTRNIKAGPNLIEMSVHFSPEEMTDTYAIAVELVEVLDHSQCTLKCNFVEKPDSLAAVIASLTTAVNDDDVASVDPYISIYLIDPFTAQIWKIPVRGKTCTHRECFDLEAFLQSRPKKHTGFQLSSADSWKCPICDKDARPHCLVLDGFLLSVSKQLRVGSDEEEEVRNIRVTADGFWKPVKAEKKETRRETSVKEDLANPTSARSTPSLNASKETVLRDAQQASRIVIDLDSD
jgi:hypothetical protein